jgi:hypothetical protein
MMWTQPLPGLVVALTALALALPLKAQDLSAYPQLAASVQRMDRDAQEAFSDNYVFSLRVPVQVESVTDDVQAVGVSCDLHSSLTDPVDTWDNVGTGIAWIVDQDRAARHPTETAERYHWDHWITADLSFFSGRLTVPVRRLHEDEIDGWTHGTCNLMIDYGLTNGADGAVRPGQPRDCGATTEVEPMAICARAGRDMSTLVSFSRPGYDLEGRAIAGDAEQ